ncbi:MAG TPA: YfiR family protein [Rhizomicrobium sp.]
MASVKMFARAVFALLLGVASVGAALADENMQLVEQEIKAGLLYNFLKYTQWPDDHSPAADGDVIVCLFGGDPFDGHLQPMSGRTVNQHAIKIRNVKGADDLSACSLVFVHANQKADWPQLQKTLAGKDVLTVSDFDGFAASGGMIEFIRADNRIGIKINVDAVKAAHLAVEDRLLKLASAVHTNATD